MRTGGAPRPAIVRIDFTTLPGDSALRREILIAHLARGELRDMRRALSALVGLWALLLAGTLTFWSSPAVWVWMSGAFLALTAVALAAALVKERRWDRLRSASGAPSRRRSGTF